MPDLNDVERRIAELRAQIAPIEREIEVLEGVARVLRALESGQPVTPPRIEDLSDLTMPKAAEQVLLDHRGEALHYRQITDLAFARGFRGKRIKKNASREKVAESFRRMMAQREDIFLPRGRGKFEINPDYVEGK